MSYLMVSKIGKKESCVVDVIEPGTEQNETARIFGRRGGRKAMQGHGAGLIIWSASKVRGR